MKHPLGATPVETVEDIDKQIDALHRRRTELLRQKETTAKYYRVSVDSDLGKSLLAYWGELDAKIKASRGYGTKMFGEGCLTVSVRNINNGYRVKGFTRPGEGLRPSADGDFFVPNKRTTAGRRIADDLEEFTHLSTGRYLTRYGFDHMYFCHGNRFRAPYFTRPFREHLYLCRPEGVPASGQIDPEPSGLEQITHEEFIKALETPRD